MEDQPPPLSFQQYRVDMWESLKALWMVGDPEQLVNFFVGPLPLRIPFVAAVSFGWTVIVSVMRGSHTPQITSTLPRSYEY